MYYVYTSLSNKRYYHGYSEDLKSRILSHEEGRVESTKNHRPIKLIFYSSFTDKSKAIKFEKYLKSSSGFAFRNKHLV